MASPLAVLTVAVTADTRALISGMNAGILGVAAFAAASVKAASDYDASFTRIAAISNASATEVAGWREEVLALSGETAQAPKELADALFFLSSAGLDAAQIMPTLEMAAKGSAVGLGETADVANILASALNAYSKSGLTAAQATDTLVAAVREGRAEPEEFATALGRVLPIASTIGVTFDQVTASLASLSNIGLDVNEGVTAMRGVFQAFAAPGKQAAEAMDEIGISSQQLLDVIGERGIIPALQMLDRAVKANTQGSAEYNNVMRRIVPNVRSLTGVFGLTAQEAAKVEEVFRRVTGSAGALDEAFATTAASPSFQLQQAFNDLSVVMVQIGSEILPAVVTAFSAIAPVVKVAADNFKLLAIAGGLLLGLRALPALLFNIGLALEAIGKAKAASAVGNLAGSLQGLAGRANVVVLALTGLVLGAKALNEALFGGDYSVGELAQKLESELGPALEEGIISAQEYADALVFMRDPSIENAEAALRAAAAIEQHKRAMEDEKAIRASAANGLASYTTALDMMVGGTHRGADATGELAGAHREAAEAAREQRAAELALAGGFLGVVGSANELRDAQAEVNDLQRRGKRGTEEYRDAVFNQLQATVGLKSSLADYGNELRESGVSSDQIVRKLTRMGEAYGLTKGDIRAVIGEVENLIGKYGDVPESVKTNVSVQDNATAKLRTIQGVANEVAGDYWLKMHISEIRNSPTPTELIASLDEGLHRLTDDRWDIGVHAPAEALAGVGGSERRGPPLYVRLDRRRFDEELDVETDYRGWG